MSHRPTLRDIGKELGLSKSTIHRALIGSNGISVKTRQLVLDTAKRLGYQRNPIYSILGSQNQRSWKHKLLIGYLHSDHSTSVGLNCLAMVQNHGQRLGYEIERVDPSEFDSGHQLMDTLYFRGFAGVLIGQVRLPDHEAILRNKHLPVVCCGRIDLLPLHTVRPDITQIVRMAWRQLLAAGYRRIGPALGTHSPPVEDDLDRHGAVLQCQAEMQPKGNRVPVLRCQLKDKKAFLEWYYRNKPDVVLGFGVSGHYSLTEVGIEIPREMGYASLHTRVGRLISGVEEPSESVAREALNLLDQLIRHNSVGIPQEPMQILLPGRWNKGKTLSSRC